MRGLRYSSGKRPAPCKDCADRHVGCHAVCERYRDWTDEKNKFQKELYEQRRFMMYFKERAERFDKQYRRDHGKDRRR